MHTFKDGIFNEFDVLLNNQYIIIPSIKPYISQSFIKTLTSLDESILLAQFKKRGFI